MLLVDGLARQSFESVFPRFSSDERSGASVVIGVVAWERRFVTKLMTWDLGFMLGILRERWGQTDDWLRFVLGWHGPEE